jgi:hypothetical protein
MPKYDAQLGNLKDQITNAQNVLVVLPAQFSTDELAASLALFLSLDAIKKQPTIVTEGTLKVSDSNLYGVGQIQKSIPGTSGGNLTLTLEGVVGSDGTVPALEKLDWYPEGGNLNLVFHVLPGQRFEPSRIVPKTQGSGFQLIFCIGAPNLNALGGVYTSNPDAFSGVTLVNIDNDPTNSGFGAINVVDPGSASVSEMVAQILPSLQLPVDGDLSSNLLAGIYSATANLTTNTKPDTFIAVGYAMQAGGKLPAPLGVDSSDNQTVRQSDSQTFRPEPVVQNNIPQSAPASNMAPLNQIFGFPVQSENNSTPPVQTGQIIPSSSEELPQGEQAYSSNPEVQNPDPDWLTPKVFKGTNLG